MSYSARSAVLKRITTAMHFVAGAGFMSLHTDNMFITLAFLVIATLFTYLGIERIQEETWLNHPASHPN